MQVPARGPIPARQKESKQKGKNFSLGFSLLCLCKQRNTLPPGGSDSPSAPVSSSAAVPGGQEHEVRTWAKEAMAEMLREAGERRLKKKRIVRGAAQPEDGNKKIDLLARSLASSSSSFSS